MLLVAAAAAAAQLLLTRLHDCNLCVRGTNSRMCTSRPAGSAENASMLVQEAALRNGF
jgi:hypothetical protein